MRKIITIVSLAAVALGTAAALAAPADAAVAVDETGTGFAGKGDVQDALGLANDAAMQSLFKAGGVTFTNGGSTGTQTITHTVQCRTTAGLNTVTRNWVITNPFTDTVTVTAQANVNGAGKLTNGWNLTGDQATSRVLGKTSSSFPQCPIGQIGSIVSSGVADSNVVTTSGLKVNAMALPNTPVEAAPIA